MDSLVGYGSDDENEYERYTSHRPSGSGGASEAPRRRDDGDNYDAVNMDLSEESEPELPQAEPARGERDTELERDHRQHKHTEDTRSRDRDRDRDRHNSREADRRSPHRDDRNKSDRSERRDGSRRGLGDKPSDRDRPGDRGDRSDRGDRGDRAGSGGERGSRSGSGRPPALMSSRPHAGEPPRSIDHRDAVSPRFTERGDRRDRSDRDRGDRDRDRDRGDRERDRGDRGGDRHNRQSEDRRSGSRSRYSEERSKRDTRPFPPAPTNSAMDHRPSPPSASGPTATGGPFTTSYKVNKKLQVMEKMGLQIKTPDGSMTTAQQLRDAATGGGGRDPALAAVAGPHSQRILDQVQKRKLLWSKKDKSEAEQAAKWSGTRFAQDNDGKQVSKFMRLMGVKEPAAIKPEPVDATADPIKKQEELFEAMQAQYEVARATTHTMRGVGLGFQRGQF